MYSRYKKQMRDQTLVMKLDEIKETVQRTLSQQQTSRGSFLDFILAPVLNIAKIVGVKGPRHDNDDANIANIQLIPTTSEILSHRAPSLPKNTSSPKSIEKLIDIHFRLLREEYVSELRSSLFLFLENYVFQKKKLQDSYRPTSKNHSNTISVEFAQKLCNLIQKNKENISTNDLAPQSNNGRISYCLSHLQFF